MALKKNIMKLYYIFTLNSHFFSFSLTRAASQFELFNELARIFSEENNASAQRAVLWREGTAKVKRALYNQRYLFLINALGAFAVC